MVEKYLKALEDIEKEYTLVSIEDCCDRDE